MKVFATHSFNQYLWAMFWEHLWCSLGYSKVEDLSTGILNLGGESERVKKIKEVKECLVRDPGR